MRPPDRDWDPIPKPNWKASDEELIEWTLDQLYHRRLSKPLADYEHKATCETSELVWKAISGQVEKRGRGRPPSDLGSITQRRLMAQQGVKYILALWREQFGHSKRGKESEVAIGIAPFFLGE
jgi:hypothetical protein